MDDLEQVVVLVAAAGAMMAILFWPWRGFSGISARLRRVPRAEIANQQRSWWHRMLG